MKLLTSAAVSLLLISLAGVSYSQISQTEREALIALFNATGGYNWSISNGWNGAAGTECDWYGVGCSYGSVSRIVLDDNSLSGSIPAELGNLTNLTSLYLNVNSLTGSIPSELGNLTNLTGLSIGDNFLTGPLPQWLSDMAIPYLNVTDAFNEWPSPYNGVTPDSSLGLAFNNIGTFSTNDSTIYTCLRVFTDGLPGSVNGIGEFDIGLVVVSLDEGTVQITKFREFNTIGAFNENAELPDCSGKFETTTGIYTDTIQVGNDVFQTTFSLTDPTNLILTLQSYETLSAN